jgi:DNA-binding IclR family transcriptional regulator
MGTDDGAPLTRSVLKALDILDYLHERSDSLAPAEIASGIGVSRPTAYRLLGTMANRGWVAKDAQDPSKYHLGYHILQLAGDFLRHLDIRSVARPFMEHLSNQYDVSVRLFILDNGEVVFLDNVMGSHPFQSLLPLGKRGCLHSKAVGKAILAYLTEEQVTSIAGVHGLEARTSRTITDIAGLLAELVHVRELGYGTADQEDDESLRAVGAAILNFQNVPIGGLAISDLVSRMSVDSMRVLGEALHDTAAKISEQLGCTQYDFEE